MNDCQIRPVGTRLLDKHPYDEFASLTGEGKWEVTKGVRFNYHVVEVEGPSIEAIAEYVQALRDQAPTEGAVSWQPQRGWHMTLDRRLVLRLVVIVKPALVDPFSPDPLEPFIGPLMNVRRVLEHWYYWRINHPGDQHVH